MASLASILNGIISNIPSALADVGIIVPGAGPFRLNPIHSMAGDRRAGKGWRVVKIPFTMRFRIGYQFQRCPVVTTQNQKEVNAQAWAPELQWCSLKWEHT